MDQGLDEDLFRGLTDELIRGFCVDTDRQRMDSTALRSAMRSLTRLGIVVESTSKFARELARFHPELQARIDPEILRRHVDREGPGSFACTAPGISKRRLGEAGQDLLALVLQFRGTAASSLSGFAILEQVLREQFEVGEDPKSGKHAKTATARNPGDIPCDGIGNPADPDSSFNAHRGRGYMAQIVETYHEDDCNKDGARELEGSSGPDLITCVKVHKMTRHDRHFLAEALDDLDRRGLKPATLLADTHYGYSENMALVLERDVRLYAPAQTPRGALKGRLTLEDFDLDDDGLVLRCPRGVVPASTSMAGAKLQARFDLTACRTCPDMERCPVRAFKYEGRFARFQYTPDRVALCKRRLFEKTDAFHEVYKWRAGVEATMSRLKHQMNLGALRIRGMPAIRHVVSFACSGPEYQAMCRSRKTNRNINRHQAITDSSMSGATRGQYRPATIPPTAKTADFLPPRQI